MGNIITRTRDEVSRTVSERTYKGETQEAGERGNGARRASPQPQQVNKYYWQKRTQSQSSYKGSKKGSAGPPLQHRGKQR